jgi:hypothetical protein
MDIRRVTNRGEKKITPHGLLRTPCLTAEGYLMFWAKGEAATESYRVVVPWEEVRQAVLSVPAMKAAERLGGDPKDAIDKLTAALATIEKAILSAPLR